MKYYVVDKPSGYSHSHGRTTLYPVETKEAAETLVGAVNFLMDEEARVAGRESSAIYFGANFHVAEMPEVLDDNDVQHELNKLEEKAAKFSEISTPVEEPIDSNVKMVLKYAKKHGYDWVTEEQIEEAIARQMDDDPQELGWMSEEDIIGMIDR